MPTLDDSLALVDTNVLVESVMASAPHHQAAAALLERAQSGDVDLCVLPQVLAEFYAVVTDSRRVSAALSVERAIDDITTFLAVPGMTELPMPADVVPTWIDLARRHNVTRGDVFDVVLVASMLGNGVRRVYTYNRADFDRFTEIEVLEP
jgi:toxin-antitoxin system PIN domain toxin